MHARAYMHSYCSALPPSQASSLLVLHVHVQKRPFSRPSIAENKNLAPTCAPVSPHGAAGEQKQTLRRYHIVHSQMHRFSRRLRRLPLFCKAIGKLLAQMIIHGYDRCKRWLRVKRFSTRGIPRDPARCRWMFNRIRQCQEDTLAQHHQQK